MARASAWALLRSLGRHRDPAGALLRRRLLSSAPTSSSSSGALPGPNHIYGHRGSRGLSSWVSSHPSPGHPPRHHAAGTAERSVHQAASSSESPLATASSEAETVPLHSEPMSFIKSTFGKLEGQHHCWLNTMNGNWRTLNEQGIYLILLYRCCGTLNSNNKCSSAFEKLKYLQRRYPRLNAFAVQHGSDTSSLAAEIQSVHTVMKEYITCPILKTDKDFSNVLASCYLKVQRTLYCSLSGMKSLRL